MKINNNNLMIANLDILISENNLSTALKNCQDTFSHNFSSEMYVTTKKQSSAQGKHVTKITVDNGDNNFCKIAAEEDTSNNTVHFVPLRFGNFSSEFYDTNVDIATYRTFDDEFSDPCYFMYYFLTEIARQNKGSFACLYTFTGSSVIIKDGNNRDMKGIAIIDSKDDVYAIDNAKMPKMSGIMPGSGFKVNKPINQWLKEHEDIRHAISQPNMDIGSKMNFIGKYLIQARTKDEIDADEFTDIFIQAGIIGFTDKSVQSIYKLIM